VQSLFALGTGGIFGTGLSTGHPEYIPAVHTDFIFAAIGEELGLAGTLAVLTLYVILIYRGFRAAICAHSEFSALLAAGLSSLLAWQVFVIVGGVTKFVPLTGVTLPFISYGGSSMLTSFLILGLLHNISENR
jgi:peptidoglycan glycosyltransferase